MHFNWIMRRMMFTALVSALLVHTAHCSKPLNMEVEWCLQGNTASFTGFFTEVLGYSSALVEILPKSRLVKSEFDYSFDELVIPHDSKVYDELFEKERKNVRKLASPIHSAIAMRDDPYLKFMQQSGEVDRDVECESPEKYTPPPQASGEKVYLDSSRPEVSLDALSFSFSLPSGKLACCHACAAEPLCLAWTLTDEKSCHLQTRFEKEPLQKLIAQATAINKDKTESFSAVMKSRKYHTPRAVIFHGTMCGYQNLSLIEQKRDINTIYIGRYMFERGSMSLYQNLAPEEYKVLMCLLRMDEVWVPTQWMKTELESASVMMGFKFPVLAVVPEAVDTTLFDPQTATTTTTTTITTVSDVTSEDSSHTYQFLSVFKWEDRKGWDVLLKAYWTAFSPHDNVVLRLHTYRPSFLMRQGQVNITENLINFARESFGKDLWELARVTLGNDSPSSTTCEVDSDVCEKEGDSSGAGGKERSDYLNRVEMRQLLHSSDAFVLPTRGEGWCLPAAEAMAMELPLIITNYSGPTAYANEENSYLIPIQEETRSDGFVEPDLDVLISLMKQVRANPREAKEKGRKARLAMKALSPQAVVTVMADRLRELAKLRGWEE